MQNQGISAMPVHRPSESQAPGSYLSADEGDDDTLAFVAEDETAEEVKDEEIPMEEEIESVEEAPDFLLDDDGPEDEIQDEDEILEEIQPPTKTEETNKKEVPPRAFDKDDEGMFFSR